MSLVPFEDPSEYEDPIAPPEPREPAAREAVEAWFKLPNHDIGFRHEGACRDSTKIIDVNCSYCRAITAMLAYSAELRAERDIFLADYFLLFECDKCAMFANPEHEGQVCGKCGGNCVKRAYSRASERMLVNQSNKLAASERSLLQAREVLKYLLMVRSIKCQHKHPGPDDSCANCRAETLLASTSAPEGDLSK